MNGSSKTARRYHWCSANLRSFIEEPHTAVTGENRGSILNLTDGSAKPTREGILKLTNDSPGRALKEIKDIIRLQNPLEKQTNGQLSLFEDDQTVVSQQTEVEIQLTNGSRDCVMPSHHEVLAEDVDLKRLGGVLATAYESNPKDFESLLLTPGLGPRTLQSLTLVSEVIHGTPSRFKDPARFSFAHGGKDGHPFPVPTRIYDESIRVLGNAIEKAKLGYKEKSECLKRLHSTALQIEKNCDPKADFDAVIKYEKSHSSEWGGRTACD